MGPHRGTRHSAAPATTAHFQHAPAPEGAAMPPYAASAASRMHEGARAEAGEAPKMEHEQSAAAATQDGEAFSSGGFTEVRPAAGRARCRRPARSLARRARPRMLWPCFVTRLRSQRFVLRCHPDLGGRGHGEKLRAGRACGAARICVRGAVARATPCAGARRASGQPGGGFERSSSLRACRPAAISVRTDT